MTIQSILFLLLVGIGVVLCAVAYTLYRVKRHEERLLHDKTRHQVRLMDWYSRLAAML